MFPKVGPAAQIAGAHLRVLLIPLLCVLVLTSGSTLSPEESQGSTASPQPESWTGTTIQLQPDLQTESLTPTDAQTEAQTETQTPSATNNYTGWSVI